MGLEFGRPSLRVRLPKALPQLRGRWKAATLALWMLVLTFAVVAAATEVYRFSLSPAMNAPFQRVGLWPWVQEGQLALDHPFSEEARRSGIRRGDVLLRIDGQVVAATDDALPEIRRMLDGPDNSVVRIVTRSKSGELREHRLTRSWSHADRFVGSLGIGTSGYRVLVEVLRMLPALLLIATAVLLCLRRREDTLAVLLSLTFLLLAAGGPPVRFYEAIGVPDLQPIIVTLGWTMFLLVVLAFPAGRFQPAWTAIAAAVLPIYWIAWTFFFVGPLLNIGDLLALSLVGLSIAALLLRYRRLADHAERQQIRWALFGFAVGVAFITIGIFGDWVLDTADSPAPMVMVFSFFALSCIYFAGLVSIAGGLLISLLRYRLYDADTVISRSAGYAVMTLAAGAIFAGSAKVLEALFEANFGGDARALAGAAGAALAAVLVTPAHNRIHAWAERRFQKTLLHLRRDLPECVNDLRETASLTELLDEVLDRITAGVRASRAAIAIGGEIVATREVAVQYAERWLPSAMLDGDGPALQAARADPLFPMRVPLRVTHKAGVDPVGWVLLGPRPDGSFYGKDERDVLAEIADPIARAVNIVLLREARQQAFETQIRVLQGELTELAKRFDLVARPSMPTGLA